MHIWVFVRRLFTHWISGMTGALSLVVTFAAAWAPQLSQRVALTVLALVCFSVGAYRVWHAKHVSLSKLESRLALERPLVVPEIVSREEPHGRQRVAIVLMNIGGRAALDVTADPIGNEDRSVSFQRIQTLRHDDGRVELPMRFVGTNDIRDVLAFLATIATIRSQREGHGPIGDDFDIPLTLKYADGSGAVFTDRSFAFTWIHSPTGAPIDTELVLRRRPAEIVAHT